MKGVKKAKYWILTNAIGLSIYFYISIPTWPTIAQQDIGLEFRPDTPADMLWLVVCYPLLFIFLIINFIWLVEFLINQKKERLVLIIIWLLVGTLWATSFVYDHNRRIRESPRLQKMRKEDDWGKWG